MMNSIQITGIVGTFVYSVLLIWSFYILCCGRFFLISNVRSNVGLGLQIRNGIEDILERSLFIVIYSLLGCVCKMIFFVRLSIFGTLDLASVCGYIISGIFILLSVILVSRQWASLNCLFSKSPLYYHGFISIVLLLTSSVVACIFATSDGFPQTRDDISQVSISTDMNRVNQIYDPISKHIIGYTFNFAYCYCISRCVSFSCSNRVITCIWITSRGTCLMIHHEKVQTLTLYS